MDLKQAFIATYYFLDYSYYVETKSKDLVQLLSNMNPFLWADGESADPATYEDWLNCAKKVEIKEPFNSEQAFNLMLEFLKFYHDEFEFVTTQIIEEVTVKTHNTPKWLACISAAMESPPCPQR